MLVVFTDDCGTFDTFGGFSAERIALAAVFGNLREEGTEVALEIILMRDYVVATK